MAGDVKIHRLVKVAFRDSDNIARLIARGKGLKAYATIAIQAYGNAVLGLSTIDRDGPELGHAGCRGLERPAQSEKAMSRRPKAPGDAIETTPGSG